MQYKCGIVQHSRAYTTLCQLQDGYGSTAADIDVWNKKRMMKSVLKLTAQNKCTVLQYDGSLWLGHLLPIAVGDIMNAELGPFFDLAYTIISSYALAG